MPSFFTEDGIDAVAQIIMRMAVQEGGLAQEVMEQIMADVTDSQENTENSGENAAVQGKSK